MIVIPNDVRCNFCIKNFCCSKCRERHEENFHNEELKLLKLDEEIKAGCYICNDQQMPLILPMSTDLEQHVADTHLPLRCARCSRIFSTLTDLKDIGKCCENDQSPSDSPIEPVNNGMSIENMGDSFDELQDKVLTPLSKINMRWRRKSKDFTKNVQDDTSGALVRQTSTPMQVNKANFIDSSSQIHMSSINCSENSSSDSDGYSPPMPAPKSPFHQPAQQVTSPKRGTLNRSRPKLPVQATPLRQVMSKSIQRAIQEHGHYRHTPPYMLQQRKMSFSSASSNDATVNLMKFPLEPESAALDLRLSPAMRRHSDENDLENVKQDCNVMSISRIEYKHIEVIVRRGEIKSDTSAVTSYKSCVSDMGRSGSLPDIQFTPKIVGHNFLKKTISFEPPNTIEKTPTFLLPIKNVEDDDEDVFYTPKATPGKSRTSSTDVIIPIDESQVQENDSKSRSNLWSLVSSVMKIASRAGEDIGETLSNSDKTWKFNFKKPEFVQKATDYFKRRSEDSDEPTFKRRRTHSNHDNRTGSQSSPVGKRQRIQARKPIERMRSDC